MNNYYIILAVADDFGTMKDDKTGKDTDWKGTRFLAQECRMKNGKTVSKTSCIIKAASDTGYVVGVPCIIYFDRNGRAAKVEEIKK